MIDYIAIPNPDRLQEAVTIASDEIRPMAFDEPIVEVVDTHSTGPCEWAVKGHYQVERGDWDVVKRVIILADGIVNDAVNDLEVVEMKYDPYWW